MRWKEPRSLMKSTGAVRTGKAHTSTMHQCTYASRPGTDLRDGKGGLTEIDADRIETALSQEDGLAPAPQPTSRPASQFPPP